MLRDIYLGESESLIRKVSEAEAGSFKKPEIEEREGRKDLPSHAIVMHYSKH